MTQSMVVQGRRLYIQDLECIRDLIRDNPSWHRTRLSKELCRHWKWHKDNGQIKDMACRTMLIKLERLGLVTLPARRRDPVCYSLEITNPGTQYSRQVIDCAFNELSEIILTVVAPSSPHNQLFNHLLSEYHYLGYKKTVGENMKYLVTDHKNQPLACVLFGSAAWKTQDRDTFIGWDQDARCQNVNLITNNTRFLILPWVRVPHLASHILGRISRRINEDWIRKYAHPVYMLETFVDRDRFKGICYKAANWILTGQTKGRTRNDRYTKIKTSIKDIYLYPLCKGFRERLQDAVG